jgi:hypothetical protein
VGDGADRNGNWHADESSGGNLMGNRNTILGKNPLFRQYGHIFWSDTAFWKEFAPGLEIENQSIYSQDSAMGRSSIEVGGSISRNLLCQSAWSPVAWC